MKIMKLNSNRNFRGLDGKRYQVNNQPGKCEKKYVLRVFKNGWWELCFNSITQDVLQFATIRDAQKYVRDWSNCITTY